MAINVYDNFVKRSLGLTIASVGLLVVAIPMGIIAVIIVTTSRGGAVYSQTRVGKDGKHFKIYKFRTMVDGAHEMLKDSELGEEHRKNFKLKNDPRITKVGKVLRKTSLDELPQLINVIKGDMSLIGPRPLVEHEVKTFWKDCEEELLSVKPGLTGNWGCSGRSDMPYCDRVKLELDYVKNISLAVDAKIFVKTVVMVLRTKGAE